MGRRARCESLHQPHAGPHQVVSLAGIQSSFAQASERVLTILLGVQLSESPVERVTEAVSEQVGADLQAKHTFGPNRAWQWHHDARGQTCAYVSLDATGIRQQGPRGARAEGRMPYVGMIYNPQLSQAWSGELSVESAQWLDEQCHSLKHEGGAGVLAELERIKLAVERA